MSYARSVSRGSTVSALPQMIRNRCGAIPASEYASRAALWCSALTSIVVSTPRAGIPDSNHSPETPAPVPISTTEVARAAAARVCSAAPVPVPIGVAPSFSPRSRARAIASGSVTKSSA